MAVLEIFLQTKREKMYAKSAEQKAAAQTFFQLLHMPNAGAYIKKFYTGSCFCYFKIEKSEPTEQDIIDAVAAAQKVDKNCIALFCVRAGPKTKLLGNLYENITIEFFDASKIYKLLKDANALPPQNIKIAKQKLTFRQFLDLLFAGANSRRYFMAGIFLTVTCLFTPFKIYYAIFASLFFAFAIISKFVPEKV